MCQPRQNYVPVARSAIQTSKEAIAEGKYDINIFTGGSCISIVSQAELTSFHFHSY